MLIGDIQTLQLWADLEKNTVLFYIYGFESKLNVFVNDWGSVVTWPPSSNASSTTTQSGHASAVSSQASP